MLGHYPDEDILHSCISTAMTATTAISVIGAAGAGQQWYITQVAGGNISSIADTIIKIFDGTALKHSVPAPRSSKIFEDYGPQGFPLSTNSAITVQLESAADCRFTIHGYKKRV